MFFLKKSPSLWAFLLSFLSFLYLFSFEIKGVWVTRWELYSPEKIESIVDSLSIANVTDAYVQVYGSGFAFFNSEIAPVRYKDFDPLEIFIEKAHSKNIKVHAWINLLYMWDRREMVDDQKHILKRYPTSVLVDDKNISLLDYSLEMIKERNIEGFYVSPSSDIVKDYILFLIDEVLLNYNVDGIHLDYSRFPGKEFVYDIFLRSNFIQKFLVDPFEIRSENSFKLFGEKGVNALLNEWQNFPKDELKSLIKDIYFLVKSRNPNIQLSSAVIADVDIASSNFYQNWWEWLNEGFIDYVIIMAYSPSISVLKKQLDKIQNKTTLSKVVVGVASYNQTVYNMSNNVRDLYNYPVLGFCIFSNQSLLDQKGSYSYVGKTIFK
ncbi:MAG: hypothetical protein XD76_1712 [candidate division TA06 bacterium 32_111]|uniref:Glycosyl hydrolase-like 10 domain-containing protein n=2 Tax=Bacteria candidate phyla TaxID=1783234 RepID=A0A101HZS6_UNCT6|nr:MAG: hypothetical protein XD76_1712 [candidate division TA06 bacterium 32_111]KUK85988.1 MAG: hypothetical protein XE03_1788 [candidate division TA06 bacterium 34_109]HAF06922.1 hypothetical protein [candidate division WOR-3 bacterium]HCP16509.1 hypothetical protein [candidate division WOR-3 bacterium]